jgi:prolyl-tRNA editing enzyme YbaK/EbsC (Cys-tRNA(Pro) deacylase)
VGHPEPLHTIVDIALSRYIEVWAAGGHPHYCALLQEQRQRSAPRVDQASASLRRCFRA